MTARQPEPRHVFVSYASVDRPIAAALVDVLESDGVTVWLDQRSIAGGTSWDAEIVRGIRGCDAVLLLVSEASVHSPNVRQELRIAWEERRPILPIVCERVAYPDELRYMLAGRQWVELVGRPQAA